MIERLPSKHEAMNPNSNTAGKKKKKPSQIPLGKCVLCVCLGLSKYKSIKNTCPSQRSSFVFQGYG
jgi:hypothetical protein